MGVSDVGSAVSRIRDIVCGKRMVLKPVVEVYVALDAIDLRWGFDRLAGVVTERLGRGARSGALFVFFGRRRTALKVLFFDGTGMCIV